ncbi:hypothetical protein EDD68_1104 [Melghiribacillus thermohalophilus]|uniref:Uncharacterized protein n=1 Tax=Melghiribacillus thermohalophilus TaxID=1324956 RepID=A0A4R3MYF8_9BACI|nr:hypothetical protein [Melghiribacillus thermohalophilus]TCT21700.1 hypothetical protein EDD68_1104 [Melghiribacillus thermohalophilus]
MKKFAKELSIKKIILTLVSLFILWNIIWFSTITIMYKPYVEKVPKNDFGVHFIEEDGYTFSVKKPDYLSFTGNLTVSNNKEGESLIIWPLVFGGYEYGVRLQKDGKAYEIYVDQHLNPVKKDQGDNMAKQIIEKYRADIETLFRKGNAIWELQ